METDFVGKPEEEIFAKIWDVAVFGAGYAGYAAAQAAAKAGKSVLLLDSRCDLLWESARARHPETGKFTPEFTPFARSVACATGISADWLDPGSAEWVANELLMESKVTRLYYAAPFGVERDKNGLLAGVTVALRSGYDRIAARQWIDATETGLIARLCSSEIASSRPVRRIARVFLQRLRWPVEIPFAFDCGIQGVKAVLEDSEWSGEKILRLEISNAYTRPFARVFTPALKALRAKLGSEYDDAFVSHWSYDPYPVYQRGRKSAASPAANLALAAPALSSGSFATLVERFTLGSAAFARLAELPSADVTDKFMKSAVKLPKPVRTVETDIFIAGLGTGGTLAAIAAGRRGAKVLGADPQSFPGGVSTAAGIPAYYWGCPGGLQREIDEAVEKLMPVYTSREKLGSGFHALTRRVVSEDLLNACGVNQLYGATVVCSAVKVRNGRILSVLAATDAGCVEIKAKAWIDATGEGELCCAAWTPGYVGRTGDGFMNAFTQSWGAFGYFNCGLQAFISNIDCGYVDPDDSLDMTTARIYGMHHIVMNSSVHSSNAFNRTTGVMPDVGLRQGKLIQTQYTMTIDDMIERRRFPDAVGFTGGHIDNHSQDFFAESVDEAFYNLSAKSWGFPTACEIPYRAILPEGLTNVWLACRAAGCDEVTCNAFRMQRDIQRIGEVAGIAASLAVAKKTTNAKVPYALLREALLASGALAPLTDKHLLFGRATTVFEGDPVLTGPATDENIAKWMEMLAEKAPGVALWRLFRVGPCALKKKCLALMKSGNAYARWHAALLLGAWCCREAMPELIEAVSKRKFPETGWRAVQGYTTAAWTLSLCGDRKAYSALAALATDKTVDNISRMTALWSASEIALREKKHATADIALLEQAMAGAKDIVEPLRPWERALCTERLRKALGLKPDKADYEALTSNRWLLTRRAYEAILS